MSTINKIFNIWFKNNIIVEFFWKSFMILIFVRILIKWNNIHFFYNVIIAIIINYTFNHDDIKIKKSHIIKDFNINNNVYLVNV